VPSIVRTLREAKKMPPRTRANAAAKPTMTPRTKVRGKANHATIINRRTITGMIPGGTHDLLRSFRFWGTACKSCQTHRLGGLSNDFGFDLREQHADRRL